jgi:hypothetical protein
MKNPAKVVASTIRFHWKAVGYANDDQCDPLVALLTDIIAYCEENGINVKDCWREARRIHASEDAEGEL